MKNLEWADFELASVLRIEIPRLAWSTPGKKPDGDEVQTYLCATTVDSRSYFSSIFTFRVFLLNVKREIFVTVQLF